ncbi:Hypothetical protein DEACI_1311 [Acididesulfobacillus acetoxydans]|uniref:Uncharacterized protein n=1 Tax=Acididesulfobacillus acetoxydans TaxID=1561005 RepID=A0A8S0W2F0_9FIRM|nr:Hypothetical protein DEACI_1311 [Acididesulfobacillus acetoxydans]CEJ09439.1 Hypothetical protein DEACI_3923 [Acididesulfobacillus acetoxydans]
MPKGYARWPKQAGNLPMDERNNANSTLPGRIAVRVFVVPVGAKRAAADGFADGFPLMTRIGRPDGCRFWE